ncbi:spherulation-specific family 4 protein [Candidatus Nitrososphaera sp. FF02]|uniref:spherulation-specific family 4 protein n=1 Tax=Candidatus Nitrososphaera sp. FF02 TaxID=3398226 RepID=UPI0039ED41CF
MAKSAFLIAIIVAGIVIVPGSALAADGIVVRSITVADAAGNSTTMLKPGQQYLTTIHISNFGSASHQYVTVFEVRDSAGITASLSFGTGVLEPRQSTLVTTEIALQEQGDYSFRAFALDGGEMPKALSPVTVTTFPVRSASYPGIYVPLYKYPDLQNPDGVWNTLFAAKRDHPSLLFVVTVNPSSGPGQEKNPVYADAISELKKSGVEHILGYIPTDYSRQDTGRTIDELKALIDRYRGWYPEINGIMFDEMHADANQLAFYSELAAHARAQGIEFIRANPGTKADENYRQIFDNIAVYEGRQLPSVMQLQGNTYYPEYPPEGFSFTVRGISTLDPEYVNQVKEYVGLLYITDDIENENDGNPYNRLPTYFAELVRLLDS